MDDTEEAKEVVEALDGSVSSASSFAVSGSTTMAASEDEDTMETPVGDVCSGAVRSFFVFLFGWGVTAVGVVAGVARG